MTDGVGVGTAGLLEAAKVASTLVLRTAKSGVRYASFGETKLAAGELERVIEAVPATVAPALGAKAFYFVPLAMAPERQGKSGETLVAATYTAELAEEAICHRNVDLRGAHGAGQHEGVFISARLLRDQFALAFEFLYQRGAWVFCDRGDSGGLYAPGLGAGAGGRARRDQPGCVGGAGRSAPKRKGRREDR